MTGFDTIVGLEVVAMRAQLRIQLGKLKEAWEDLSVLEQAAAEEPNNLYLIDRCRTVHGSIIEELVKTYESDASIRSATQDILRFWRETAEAGSAQAAWLLIRAARAQFYPSIIPPAEQLVWLRKACSTGDPHANELLAKIYDEGRDFALRDHAAADRLFAKSFCIYLVDAVKGSRPAMLDLARLLRLGVDGTTGKRECNVAGDYGRARHWYIRCLGDSFSVANSRERLLSTKPADELAAMAMIGLAQVEQVLGCDAASRLTIYRYRWAARFGNALALRELADQLDKLAGCGREPCRAWLYRKAGQLGDQESLFKFACLRHRQRSSLNKDGGLTYDKEFIAEISGVLSYPKAIFIRGLYPLILNQAETDSARQFADISAAFSLDFVLPSYHHENLSDHVFVAKISAVGRAIREELDKVRISGAATLQSESRLAGHGCHYNRQFLKIVRRLRRSGLMGQRSVVQWLELRSLLADHLNEPERRYWNQLVVDAQLASPEFKLPYWEGPQAPPLLRFLSGTSPISNSYLKFGPCFNARSLEGLPILGSWRSRTFKDAPGWDEPPEITVTESGFSTKLKARHGLVPPMITEEDIDVILTLALLEGGTSGKPFYFSLEPFECKEDPAYQWKFHKKVFFPPWLAGTRFGETLYYTDLLHLRSATGRDTPSFKHARITAEYDPEWRHVFPWDDCQVSGVSAWNCTNSRSAIHLERLAGVEDTNCSRDKIVIPSDFQTLMKFDGSQIAWENGEEKRELGAGNIRYRTVRSAAYRTAHYCAYADDYPVFQRVALLKGIYALACTKLKSFSLPANCSLYHRLESARKKFQRKEQKEKFLNPNLVVFDLR